MKTGHNWAVGSSCVLSNAASTVRENAIVQLRVGEAYFIVLTLLYWVNVLESSHLFDYDICEAGILYEKGKKVVRMNDILSCVCKQIHHHCQFERRH